MTIDARTLVAVMRKAPGYEQIIEALADDDHARICATAVAEAAILIGAATDPMARLNVDIAIRQLNLAVVPFTNSDVPHAIDEYRRLAETQERRPVLGQCLTGAIAAKTGSRLLKHG